MNILSIYYDHWGREQNEARRKKSQLKYIRTVLGCVYAFTVREVDHDPRNGNFVWGVVEENDPDFWHHLKFVSGNFSFGEGNGNVWFPSTPKHRFARVQMLANLLFPPQSPEWIPRFQTGTRWEHEHMQRRSICRLNALSYSTFSQESLATLSRLNALIALPPLIF
jgi:hypothetical protein